jgi:hypothetical protein
MARLSIDQVSKLKKNAQMGNGMSVTFRYDTMMDLFETIEAQQQEIDELNNELSMCGMKEYLERMYKSEDKVKAQQQEIEQLQAACAVMRNILEKCSWYGGEGLCIDEKLAMDIMEALKPDAGKELLDKLHMYEQEAGKIPFVCRVNIPNKNKCASQEWKQRNCPKICPKYKESEG